MIEIKGKYNTAKVYTDMVEETAVSQIITLLNEQTFKDSKIRIMPDVHAGKGCTIGFTADMGDMVIPNLIGVDIGCGMMTTSIDISKENIDFQKLDNVIREKIPHGHNIHSGRVKKFSAIKDLNCLRDISVRGWSAAKWERQVGTLGGGNHFIELSTDKEDNVYLILHSGSRHLGKSVADYYQNLAIELRSGKEEFFTAKDKLIKKFKSEGKKHLIQSEIKKLDKEYKRKTPDVPKDLCYLTGKYRDMYLHDMNIAQKFAFINRETMTDIIMKEMNWKVIKSFQTIHNYISFEDNIIRKGAVSANTGEQLLIPLSMAHGSLLCIGKGNNDWNCSAPHGAGRKFSRSRAKKEIDMADYINAMDGIYSTSVSQATLDEAPQAYKDPSDIIENISETVDVVSMLKPFYNFKSS